MRFHTLLAHRDVRCLWMGQICSQLGDRLIQMILIAVVGLRVPGSTLALSKMMACTIVPAFFISPLAGAYVDRWDRRRTMLVCDLARGACVLALPIVTAWATLRPTYALVFLLFAIACFFLPARLALLPALVPPGGLVAANSLMTTSGMIAATSSVLVGGLLVERLGVPASCLVASVSYLGSAGCIFLMHHRALPPAAPRRPWALLTEIREGLAYAFGQRHAQFVLGVLAVLMGAAGAIVVVSAVVVQQAMGSVTRDLGIFGITLGAGLALGTVWYGHAGHSWPKPWVIVSALFVSGLWLLGFAWGVGMRHSWGAGAITTVGIGIALAPIGIAVNAMIHEVVHDRLWGRVFSAMGIVMNAALLVGLWAAGVAAERITPLGTLLAVSSVVCVAGGVGIGIARVRGRAAVL